MPKMIEVTFVRNKLSPLEIKLAKHIKKKGFKVTAITFYQLKKEYRKKFDENIYWLKQKDATLNKISKVLQFPIFLKRMRKKKNNILIGVTSSSNWFTSLIFFILRNKAEKRIYFPYDIAYFRYKDYKTYPWYVRWSEKYNFRNCDGIIHKGPEDELKYLPKEFKALEKPTIQFLPYCDEDDFVPIDENYFKNKLSNKDGEIHLVYVGGVYHNHKAHFDTIDVFKKIVNQKLHIHVYTTIYKKIVTDSDFKKLCENKYFHLHKPIYGKKFQKEISKYDWGVIIFFINFSKLRKIWADTAFSNKASSYIEAGLPIIHNKEEKNSAEFIKKNRFGIIINKTSQILGRIQEIDYKKIVKSIKKNRSFFTFKANIGNLIEFLEK